jgi:outer membrane protein TolC
VRAMPLSAVSSLWPMLKKLLEPDRQSAARRKAEERLAILKKIITEKEQLFRAGRLSMEEMLEARMRVKKAELELCDTREERVAAHAAIVALAKEVEKVRDTLYKAGQCSFSSLAEARIAVLEAETALEKAKAQRTSKDN